MSKTKPTKRETGLASSILRTVELMRTTEEYDLGNESKEKREQREFREGMENLIKLDFLVQLMECPSIDLVCEKIGIAKKIYYSWFAQDEEFRRTVRMTLTRPELFTNKAESLVIKGIIEGDIKCAQIWLRRYPAKGY